MMSDRSGKLEEARTAYERAEDILRQVIRSWGSDLETISNLLNKIPLLSFSQTLGLLGTWMVLTVSGSYLVHIVNIVCGRIAEQRGKKRTEEELQLQIKLQGQC